MGGGGRELALLRRPVLGGGSGVLREEISALVLAAQGGLCR